MANSNYNWFTATFKEGLSRSYVAGVLAECIGDIVQSMLNDSAVSSAWVTEFQYSTNRFDQALRVFSLLDAHNLDINLILSFHRAVLNEDGIRSVLRDRFELVPTRTQTWPNNPTMEVTTTLPAEQMPFEVYYHHLLRKHRGIPLYSPAPRDTLPETYREAGVFIGDVGRITSDGSFDFFFNVYRAADDPVNVNGVPAGFTLLAMYPHYHISHKTRRPGDFVGSLSIQLESTQPFDPSHFPGAEYIFHSTHSDGAVLALPHGSQVQKVEAIRTMRQYAAQNAKYWYEFALGPELGRDIENGQLYFVTGWEKAPSWGIASFQTGYTPQAIAQQLRFQPTAPLESQYKYRWSCLPSIADTDFADAPMITAPLNQTLFLHAFAISLDEALWLQLLAGNDAVQTVHHPPAAGPGFSSLQISPHRASSWMASFSRLIPGSGGGNTDDAAEQGSSDVFMSATPPPPPSRLFHPSQLINEELLRQINGVTVAITHSDDWMEILDDSRPSPLAAVTPELFKEAIYDDCLEVKKEEGFVYLERLSAPTSSALMLRELRPHASTNPPSQVNRRRPPSQLSSSSQPDLQRQDAKENTQQKKTSCSKQRFRAGNRVFYWDGGGRTVYCVIKSLAIIPGGTVAVTAITDSGTTMRLPAAALQNLSV
ncbi:WD40 containing domain protein [Mycena indigotica]|uniref:WD40 containing domain protein n=1 Tax=Mycena indigotica TaxID=2126181 RepID=A0A8H6T932_9AGAR|nr:WD40 containing domain protein [Mycena indigotica]KAF7312461.1 WD40 containing domain protein [Mycena indigotica]